MSNEEKIIALEVECKKVERYLSETKSKTAAKTYLNLIAEMRLEISKLS